MIPFAICRGTLIFRQDQNRIFRNEMPEKTRTLEVRLLELGPDYGTIRLPRSFVGQEAAVEKLQLCFFLRKEGPRRMELEMTGQIREKKIEKFWVEWEFTCQDPEFIQAAQILSREYMDYVEARLTMDDAELSHHMTGQYPVDESICETVSQQLQLFADQVNQGIRQESWNPEHFQDPPFSLGIALECRSAYQAFLQTSWSEFQKDYWAKSKIPHHPLAQRNIDFLAVGNPFCPLQGPELEELLEILAKAREHHLATQYILAPGTGLRVHSVQQFLCNLHQQLPPGYLLDVLVGDAGIQYWMEQMDFPGFRVLPGQLMVKQPRDSRRKYLQDWPLPECDATQQTVYLPYQQMNTGTFCTMHAMVTRGDRGQQERVRECPGYCEQYRFLYPKELHMMGRYNSVFQMNLEQLQDGSRIKGTKVVLNF